MECGKPNNRQSHQHTSTSHLGVIKYIIPGYPQQETSFGDGLLLGPHDDLLLAASRWLRVVDPHSDVGLVASGLHRFIIPFGYHIWSYLRQWTPIFLLHLAFQRFSPGFWHVKKDGPFPVAIPKVPAFPCWCSTLGHCGRIEPNLASIACGPLHSGVLLAKDRTEPRWRVEDPWGNMVLNNQLFVCYIYVEWASALVPPTPQFGGSGR